MRNEIILETAFMKSTPYLASFFSFVEINHVTVPWLVKFFTSLSASTKGEDNEFETCCHSIVFPLYLDDYFLMSCPFVEVCNINQRLLTSDIIEVIENAILNGYCMVAVINPQLIKVYGEIQLNEHDLMISGFDDVNKVLIGYDFFPPSYKYVKREIPYQEYMDAFNARDRKYNIRFIKKKKVVSEPDDDMLIKVLLETLTNMLNEKMQVENPYYSLTYQVKKDKIGEYVEKKEEWTGIGVYDGMAQNIEKIPSKFWIMLMDVHRLIRYALSLVLPDREEVKAFQNIEKELNVILNIGIKHNIDAKKEELDRMSERLKRLKDKERSCINSLIIQLKNISQS